MSILDTLEDLEEAIDGGLSVKNLCSTWAKERDKKNRKGALELLGDKICDHAKSGSDIDVASEKEKFENVIKISNLESELEDAQVQIEVLERKIRELKETPASIAQENKFSTYASMFNKDNVFVVAPLHEVERWTALSKITKYVLDVQGPHAAACCKQFPHEYRELEDGTFRILTPSVRVARVLENKLKNMCANKKWTGHTFHVSSLGTSECIAKDAVRGGGLARMREMCIIGASAALTIESSIDENGEPKELKLSWK